MEVFSHLNEAIFATVTVKLRQELWSLSRGNRAAERVGNAWQSKAVKTIGTTHCASGNAHDVPKQNKLLEQWVETRTNLHVHEISRIFEVLLKIP